MLRSFNTRKGFSAVELVVAMAIIGLIGALSLTAVQKVRASMARIACQHQMRQIALALHHHAQRQSALPPACTSDEPGRSQPYMSWHVRILPDLEQATLYDASLKAFELDRDFRQKPHQDLTSRAFLQYGCPLDSRTLAPQTLSKTVTRGLTSYLGVNGLRASREDGVLYLNSAVRLNAISDGLSNTLMVGERPPSADMVIGWWYAGWGQDKNGEGDMHLGVRTRNNDRFSPQCLIGPHDYQPGNLTNQCDFLHFWSLHSGGANFAFADGSVRFLSYSANDIMPAMATRAAGDSVTLPD